MLLVTHELTFLACFCPQSKKKKLIEKKIRTFIAEQSQDSSDSNESSIENVEILINTINTSFLQNEMFAFNRNVISAAKNLIDALEDMVDEA